MFSPMINKHVRHARKNLIKPTPLFPGYVFVAFDPEIDRWRPINSTPGVVSIVKLGSVPPPLPEGLVEALQAASSRTGLIERIGPQANIGDDVRVLGGAFDDWIGRVIALPAADRITLLLDAATRKIKLTLEADQALLVSKAPPSASSRSLSAGAAS